jgi:hypothetical protein
MISLLLLLPLSTFVLLLYQLSDIVRAGITEGRRTSRQNFLAFHAKIKIYFIAEKKSSKAIRISKAKCDRAKADGSCLQVSMTDSCL